VENGCRGRRGNQSSCSTAKPRVIHLRSTSSQTQSSYCLGSSKEACQCQGKGADARGAHCRVQWQVKSLSRRYSERQRDWTADDTCTTDGCGIKACSSRPHIGETHCLVCEREKLELRTSVDTVQHVIDPDAVSRHLTAIIPRPQ
jgi:hypothetical protein